MSARVLAICLALAGLLAAGCGGDDAPRERRPEGRRPIVLAPSTTPVPTPRPARQDVGGQDPQDRDPRLARRDARAVKRHPILQLLPVTERHLAIDMTGVAADGGIELLVQTDLTLTHARRAYRRFLARHRDGGRGYAPRFERVGEG
jgi:hypothetical protein